MTEPVQDSASSVSSSENSLAKNKHQTAEKPPVNESNGAADSDISVGPVEPPKKSSSLSRFLRWLVNPCGVGRADSMDVLDGDRPMEKPKDSSNDKKNADNVQEEMIVSSTSAPALQSSPPQFSSAPTSPLTLVRNSKLDPSAIFVGEEFPYMDSESSSDDGEHR